MFILRKKLPGIYGDYNTKTNTQISNLRTNTNLPLSTSLKYLATIKIRYRHFDFLLRHL